MEGSVLMKNWFRLTNTNPGFVVGLHALRESHQV